MQTGSIVQAPFRTPGGYPLATGSGTYSDDVSTADSPSTTRSEDKETELHVFVDPATFRYLEEDKQFEVYQRDKVLEGYELYIVQEWVVSRTEPTYCIATFTGNPHHKITVNIARIPKGKNRWPHRLTFYFEKMKENHARLKDSGVGLIPVTSITSLPNSLNPIAVPDGIMAKHRKDFIINVNLKRMQCTGRSAVSLRPASDDARSKFKGLFKTSDKVPFEESVQELVRMVQVALVMFGELKLGYADGLLCDPTEKAIQHWWADFGIPVLNMDTHPHEAGFTPPAVASILGLYMGARNRLQALGQPVPKDAFDTDQLKIAIGHFQKAYKIRPEGKGRRLDVKTMDRLHDLTKKFVKKQAASNIGPFAFPRAFKSTVADLSGRTRDATIAGIETGDFDTFKANVYGDYPKFLWYGKPMKSKPEKDHHYSKELRMSHLEHDRDSVATGTTNSVYNDSQTGSMVQLTSLNPSNPAMPTVPLHNSGSSDPLRRTAIRNMAGRNAESGLKDHEQTHHGFRDKIKDAVSSSRRHNRQKHSMHISKDDGRDSEAGEGSQKRASLDLDLLRKTSFRGKKSSPSSSASKLQESQESPRGSQNAISNSRLAPLGHQKTPSIGKVPSAASSKELLCAGSFPIELERESRQPQQGENDKSKSPSSVQQDRRPNVLGRAHSFSRLHELSSTRNNAYYPRRMSYSLAEEALSTAPEPLLVELIEEEHTMSSTGEADDELFSHSSPSELFTHRYRSPDYDESIWNPSGSFYKEMTDVRDWARKELKKFKEYEITVSETCKELKKVELDFKETLEQIKLIVAETVPNGIVPVKEKLEEVNGLEQRLQYEINSLKSRVKELTECADNFHNGVVRIEDKAARGGFDIGQSNGGANGTGEAHKHEPVEPRQGWLGWGLGFFRHREQQSTVESKAVTEPVQDSTTPEAEPQSPQKQAESEALQKPLDSQQPQEPRKSQQPERTFSPQDEENRLEEDDYFDTEERGYQKLHDAVYGDEALQKANSRPQVGHRYETYANGIPHESFLGAESGRPRHRKHASLNKIET